MRSGVFCLYGAIESAPTAASGGFMFATRTITSSILVVGITTVLMAQAPALDVKLGLWENTIVTNMGMAAPAVDTSKMPPEQAAKIAEMMKGMMGDRTVVEKNCLTKEDLAK